MISYLGKKWLSEMQFMGVSHFNWRTANNIILSIKSVALIDFALKPNTEKIKVLFLITSELVENSIFGYNLNKH